MRLISIQMKYQAWRDLLMKAWRLFGRSGVSHQSVSSRARALLRMLKYVCQKMDGVEEHGWAASLGRNISHVNGPIAVLLRLGVLKNVQKPKQAAKGQHFLKLGLQKSVRRRLCKGWSEKATALSKISTMVRLADDVHVSHAPRTCADWVRAFGSLDAKFQEHRTFPPRSYMRHWLIRGVLLAAMARDGVEQLTSPQDVSLPDFMKSNPDSSSWVKKLQVKGHGGSAKAFFDTIGYQGAPELCTMH